MSDMGSFTPRPALLPDPWEEKAPIPLDGVLERNQFPPLLTAFAGLFLAFVLFQVVISPLAIVVLLMLDGVDPETVLGRLDTLLEEQLRTLLIANSVGQFLGLGLLALLLARLHTRRPAALLRLRRTDLPMLGLSLAGLLALTPCVQWLGALNEHLPLPEAVRELEQSQLELIERVLLSDAGLGFNLLALAVTPALCEEVLFRGYVQRQTERALGAARGILFSGVVFGLYHLRPSQVLPLCVLGVYLAYLAWRTGSLWIPVVVHFANNAFAVAAGAYAARQGDLDLSDLEAMMMPWYLALVGLACFGVVLYGFRRWAHLQLERRAVPGSSG